MMGKAAVEVGGLFEERQVTIKRGPTMKRGGYRDNAMKRTDEHCQPGVVGLSPIPG